MFVWLALLLHVTRSPNGVRWISVVNCSLITKFLILVLSKNLAEVVSKEFSSTSIVNSSCGTKLKHGISKCRIQLHLHMIHECIHHPETVSRGCKTP